MPVAAAGAAQEYSVRPRRDAGAAEPARLESVWGATPRGFKSHSLRSDGPPDGRAVLFVLALLGADAHTEHLGAGRPTRLRFRRGGRRSRRVRVRVLRL